MNPRIRPFPSQIPFLYWLLIQPISLLSRDRFPAFCFYLILSVHLHLLRIIKLFITEFILIFWILHRYNIHFPPNDHFSPFQYYCFSQSVLAFCLFLALSLRGSFLIVIFFLQRPRQSSKSEL